MKAIMVMFDSLNRRMLSPYGDAATHTPNFARLAERSVVFDNFYAGSMPCVPARRELHTGRHNFLHRSWGPLEPFDDSVPELLGRAGVQTHLSTDHQHYWEDGGATYHTRYTTWEFERGQEGDPWKGVVDATAPGNNTMRRQDKVNRSYMPTEAEHCQTRVLDNGLHFLERNADADNWMLQIECFDPHEPFFTHQRYRDLFPDDYDGEEFDWPGYRKVSEPAAQSERARNRYASLLAMCDHSLGRVLDAMDERDMWDDTMLIVNTDHGFLLGEHGWWAKTVMPWYNELVHLPFFLWDPRTRQRGERRGSLAQTIDIGPTLLGLFGVDPTPDMQGRDLAAALATDAPMRDGALFGLHGDHVNITDGRYVYMRAPHTTDNQPLADYTLMPTRMRARCSVDELRAWEVAEPFTFTKGLSTMRIATGDRKRNPFTFGTLLFDLKADPGQEHPLIDDETELRMLRLLQTRMRASDAPDEQYERLGFPRDAEPTTEHLLARDSAERATAIMEPLPPFDDLASADVLRTPLADVLNDPRQFPIVERSAPELTRTELVNVRPDATLLDLAATAIIPAAVLRTLDKEFTAALPPQGTHTKLHQNKEEQA